LKKLSKDALLKLTNQKSDSPAVTIYMPTHEVSAPPHMQEDQIRFKNMVNKALRILDSREPDEDFKRFISKQAEEILGNQIFWEHLSRSLLLCIRRGLFETMLLPVDADEYAAVDNHFHLAPVFGLLEDDADYYVLAIAKHKPRFFKGNMYGLAEEGLNLPSSPEEALNIDEMQQKQQHYHQNAGGFGTGQNAGRGATDTGRQETHDYFALIDKIIHDNCDTSRTLVLAGTEDAVGNFRQASKYPWIADAYIEGNHTRSKSHELFRLAWKVVSDQNRLKKQTSLKDLHRFYNGRKEGSSTNPAVIVKAAEEGRIDRLLLAISRITRDTIRDSDESVPKIVFPSENESQLVDRAARLTWRNSGKVYNLTEGDLPGGVRMAAVFRY
jgi:hypothetical protein